MVNKPFEDDDPMQLTGMALPGGDMQEAAEAFVEEFVRMGLQDEPLLDLFKNPFYRATHRIYKAKGEAYVKSLIERIRRRRTMDDAE
ncbi:MAG: hypothetical protein ACE5IQ_06295 [Candidatus Methylomirabilales bacterium]